FAAMSPSSTSLRFVFCCACGLLVLAIGRPATCWLSWLLLNTSEAVAVYRFVCCAEKTMAAAVTIAKHTVIQRIRRWRMFSTCSMSRLLWSASVKLHSPAASVCGGNVVLGNYAPARYRNEREFSRQTSVIQAKYR